MNDPSARRARGAATRTRLLDAAERLLEDGGFEALTTTAVAREAGVATGTFYVHFSDKHALLAALFAHRLDGVVDRVEAVLSSDNLLDEGIEATLGGAVDVVLAAYRSHAQLFRSALGRIQAREDLRVVYWDRHARALAIIERFVRRAGAAGMARRDRVKVVAHTVLLLTEALNHPVLTAASDRRLARAVRNELVRAITGVVRPPAAEGQGGR